MPTSAPHARPVSRQEYNFEGDDSKLVCRKADEEQDAACDPDHSCIPGSEFDAMLSDGRVRLKQALNMEKQPGGVGGVDGSETSVIKKMSILDRFLFVWIALAMGLGLLLGNTVPGIQEAFEVVTVDGVSVVIAIGLWGMMWPVLCKVQYEVLPKLFTQRSLWGSVGLSLAINWVVGPALMTGLAWATLPDLDGYRNGCILVGLARCIAMVLIWNTVAGGDTDYCAILVAINSVLQIVLYAPLAIFYLQVVSRQYLDEGLSIGMWAVCKNVLIFLGIPLALGVITRFTVLATKGRRWMDERFLPLFGPVALLSLLYTIVIMFSIQGENIVANPLGVLRVAVPLLLYFGLMWVGTFALCRSLRMPYPLTATQSFTAAGNNFELAIAIAVGLFGIDSDEALAATIGPLIEVPALLSLTYLSLYLRRKLTWP